MDMSFAFRCVSCPEHQNKFSHRQEALEPMLCNCLAEIASIRPDKLLLNTHTSGGALCLPTSYVWFGCVETLRAKVLVEEARPKDGRFVYFFCRQLELSVCSLCELCLPLLYAPNVLRFCVCFGNALISCAANRLATFQQLASLMRLFKTFDNLSLAPYC
eukprot:3745346-Amphidinium_carterae.1